MFIVHIIALVCPFTKWYQRVSSMVIDYKIVLQQTEVVTRRYSVKKVFLKMSQNSQESTYARASFLMKLQDLGLQLY